MSERLVVDPIRCDAYGHCAELLPELIELDEWGYPIVATEPVPEQLLGDARRAIAACPRLALRLVSVDAGGASPRATPPAASRSCSTCRAPGAAARRS